MNDMKFGFNSIRTQPDNRELSRKQIRDKEKKEYNKYPKASLHEFVPNDWKTIKEVKNILSQLK